MAQQHKIQDYDPVYSFLRYYVDFVLKLSYRTIRYVGRENVPTDGAIIYAPNHTNALMDALVILAMDRKAKVFVARADIFKNPTFAKILSFLKIMPIMRMRDGIDEVRKNNETIERAVDVLRDGVPFCIFPEGQHLAKHSALPLSKGIFRIALQAQEQLHEVPLYIVPVSLHYGNFFRFRSTVLVQIGHPIPVKEFIDRAFSEYERLKEKGRPEYIVKEKEALKLLRKKRAERPSDFNKRISKKLSEEMSDSVYNSLLPFYQISDGAFLSDEYTFLKFNESVKFTKEFFSELKKEELLNEKPDGVVIAVSADGDNILYLKDGSVIRFSHEAPEILCRWFSPAMFFVDAINNSV